MCLDIFFYFYFVLCILFYCSLFYLNKDMYQCSPNWIYDPFKGYNRQWNVRTPNNFSEITAKQWPISSSHAYCQKEEHLILILSNRMSVVGAWVANFCLRGQILLKICSSSRYKEEIVLAFSCWHHQSQPI